MSAQRLEDFVSTSNNFWVSFEQGLIKFLERLLTFVCCVVLPGLILLVSVNDPLNPKNVPIILMLLSLFAGYVATMSLTKSKKKYDWRVWLSIIIAYLFFGAFIYSLFAVST